ncbi:MAG: ABC transporter permease [Bryobacterales bacterium]|nr:ABC transporter permease [Bryobacterales bacterium]
MNRYWIPACMLFQRELLRFWREKSRVAGFAGTPVVFWLVVGSGYSDFARFLPGALVLTVMFSAIFSAMSLIEDRKEGFLLCVLASPAPRLAIVLGKVAGGALIAASQTMVFLFLATLGGTLYPNAQLGALAGLLVLIAIAFTAAGFLIAWLIPSPQGFHAIINLIFVPLWMISGAIFSLQQSHAWMRWLMLVNPVTYAQDAIARGLGLPFADGHPIGPLIPIVVVSVSAIVTLVVAAMVINRPSERNLL